LVSGVVRKGLLHRPFSIDLVKKHLACVVKIHTATFTTEEPHPHQDVSRLEVVHGFFAIAYPLATYGKGIFICPLYETYRNLKSRCVSTVCLLNWLPIAFA